MVVGLGGLEIVLEHVVAVVEGVIVLVAVTVAVLHLAVVLLVLLLVLQSAGERLRLLCQHFVHLAVIGDSDISLTVHEYIL